MEHEEWRMNEQVRDDIAFVQANYGLDEEEAWAFWHLARARKLMVGLVTADEHPTREIREEEHSSLPELAKLGREIADAISYAAETETRLSQHFSALYKELGLRVLKRQYPHGWGGEKPGEEQGG